MEATPTMKPDEWLSFIADPTWLPHDYEPRDDTLTFVRLDREAQRRAIYLDQRFLARAPKSMPAPIHELPVDAIAARAQPMHFVFHTSFCASTLMARALDVPGVAMGLKEPAVLLSFADAWAGGRRSPGASTVLNAALNLLSRPLAPGEINVVKPVNIVNYLIPIFMNWRRDTKAIVMHSTLDAFLRAIARRGLEGRNFARGVHHQLSTAIPLEHGLSAEDMVRMSDLQIAAMAWLMQTAFVSSVVKIFGPERIRLLNGDRFVAEPAPTMSRLSAFFGLAMNDQQISDLVEGPVFREHSKQPMLAFDASSQKAQFENTGTIHFEELNAVRAWARRFAARLDLATELEDTL
ncbi:hypothetical protein [Terricaulis sp.]|uniref:hypothetical protein n=1 Tax=Terricaulis sp. TaxID=2768686 RepID=UPI0037851510